MRKTVFAGSAAAAAALLMLLAGLPIATAADAPPAPDAIWAQARSDIPPDSAVRFGVLPNGMRYAILRNGLPAGLVSLRLRIGAGSLEESDAQRGLAHFLEHMAFRGSTHVPDGEVNKTLERLGLRFGADTNAATGQTQTTFRFDLPKNDEQTLDTGLMLMREIASELTLDQSAMDKERGVVLSEERIGAGPGRRAQEDQSQFLLQGQLAPLRFPIGKVDVIRNATASQIRDFYNAYYRPERAALVVVGDIDPGLVGAKINGHFADWRNANPPGADPDLGAPAKRDLETELFTEPGARSAIMVSWVSQYDAPPATQAKEKQDMIVAVGMAILNQRLGRVALGANPPFAGAGAYYGNNSRSAKIASLSVTFAEGRWQRALTEADKIRRQTIELGVRQDEVDQQIEAMLTGIRAGVARASTRQTPGLANGILGDIDQDEVYTSPERDLEVATANLTGLTADDVNDAMRNVFAGNGPLIFASSPKPIAGGDAALRQAFLDAEKIAVAAAQAPKKTTWSHTKFGRPGRVVERKTIEDLGVTYVRFANGVRLTVKPTKFRADEILVSAQVGAGILAFPKNRPTVAWAEGDLIAGGLNDLEFVDMRRLLSSRIYGVSFGAVDDGFVLSGGTRPADLDLQMQVLAAYLTAPGWRPEAFQRTQNAWLMQLERADLTPTDVFNAQLPALLRSGDARWAFPKLDDIQSARPQELKSLLTPALARGPIEVVMVGDTTVEQAIQSVAATFGSLPKRPTVKTVARQGELRFPDPTPTPIVLSHSGRADQGLAFIAWPNTDIVSDMKDVAIRRVLMEVVRMRMTEQLRTNDGATYSPSAGSQSSLAFPGYGYLDAVAEIPPDKTPLFFETIARVAADLSAQGPTEDELQRVRVPAVAAATRNLQTNGFWAANLKGAQFDERHLSLIRSSVSGVDEVTAADVQRFAQKYLVDSKAWKLVIVPKPPQTTAASPTADIPVSAN